MNAQKDFVESDEKFEAGWTQLRVECAAVNVEITDPEPVRSYLQAHPDMIELTGKICASARREFGAEAPLKMDVFVDCENDDRWIRVAVCLARNEPGLGERLDAVTEPFDEELCCASGEISVTVNFVRSR